MIGIFNNALGVPAVVFALAWLVRDLGFEKRTGGYSRGLRRRMRGLDFMPRTGCSGRGFGPGVACA